MAREFTPISAEARRTLERELAALRGKRQRVAAGLPPEDEDDRMADSMRLEPLDARIAEINAWLRWAPHAGPSAADVISIGSLVTVRSANGEERTVRIAVVAQAPDPLLITANSPLGHAVLGHRVGDAVTYDTTQGQTTVTVLSVQQPSADQQ